jgi:hypothetical protein
MCDIFMNNDDLHFMIPKQIFLLRYLWKQDLLVKPENPTLS